MPDGTDPTTTPAAGTPGGESRDDAAFYQEEAKKAFKARDEAKAALRKLQDSGLVLTDEQKSRYAEMEAAAAKAEEDRAKKAGEFDTLRSQLVKKHGEELETERQARTKAETDIQSLIKENAFAQATDLFGASTAKTIYSAKAAQKVFDEFVRVDVVDGKRRLVVLGLDGQPLLDAKTGQPASFAQAMSELLEALPDKDQHLRGSGKTGSGNSGGAPGGRAPVVDITQLKPADFQDPKVREQVKRQQAQAGGLVQGRAWER